jgi:glycosyltransferase involved in cell wall biosynthesis
MNKNVLMVCYYYPPLRDVGCKRSVAFSKYFGKHGWTPHILSVKNPDKSYCALGNGKPYEDFHTTYSYSLINLTRFVGLTNSLLSKGLKLFGLTPKCNYVHNLLCIPDQFWGWIPLTTIKGVDLIRKTNIDLIYVSCTPISAAVIGVLLKKFTGKPLVIDFRDPFAIGYVFSILGVPEFRRRIDRGIQRFLFRVSDIFIVNNEETEEIYLKEYPEAKGKIFNVHNGFDSDFLIQTDRKKFDKFTIVYTGEFYWYALKSKVFFEALSLLKSNGKIDSTNFQFLFYGDGEDEIEKVAQDYEIEDIVIANSRIPYKDVLNVLSKSHLQLLRIVKPMISTKLFDGIPLNVPFLATIPQGEVERIIKEYSPSSYIVTEESAVKVADAILNAMTKYKRNEIQDNYIGEFLGSFSREKLTLKLMNIIEQNLDRQGRDQ